MLLEAIFKYLDNIDMYDIAIYARVETLLNILLNAHPQRPEKPKYIIPYWDSKKKIYFTFIYKKQARNLTFEEFCQYFCTVLGEKE